MEVDYIVKPESGARASSRSARPQSHVDRYPDVISSVYSKLVGTSNPIWAIFSSDRKIGESVVSIR